MTEKNHVEYWTHTQDFHPVLHVLPEAGDQVLSHDLPVFSLALEPDKAEPQMEVCNQKP